MGALVILILQIKKLRHRDHRTFPKVSSVTRYINQGFTRETKLKDDYIHINLQAYVYTHCTINSTNAIYSERGSVVGRNF